MLRFLLTRNLNDNRKTENTVIPLGIMRYVKTEHEMYVQGDHKDIIPYLVINP